MIPDKYAQYIISKTRSKILLRHFNKKAQKRYQNFDFENNIPETISFQTLADCNLACKCCPYYKGTNLFKDGIGKAMMFDIFKKALWEIPQDYAGMIALFNLNEPTLDDRLPLWTKIARARLPQAYIGLDTNGIKLTEEKARELIDAGTDRLMVNDYTPHQYIIRRIKSWNLPASYLKHISFFEGG